ncbi:hypothetical protein [Candidatus Uabimicrobium sp. HlEnr_7]|uniref:hypothetical protein n=1 Tax=Candidatus Uabimicrobium helgolandensis TaxID=3095367 RepID=UPI0035573611
MKNDIKDFCWAGIVGFILFMLGKSMSKNELASIAKWMCIFIAATYICYYILKHKKILNPIAKLNCIFFPLLVPIMWLHAVFFHVPNNWAVMKKYGFFGFWFRPNRDFDFDLVHLKLLIPIILATIFITIAITKNYAKTFSNTRAGFAMVYWFFAAIILRHIVHVINDGMVFRYAMREIGLCITLGAPLTWAAMSNTVRTFTKQHASGSLLQLIILNCFVVISQLIILMIFAYPEFAKRAAISNYSYVMIVITIVLIFSATLGLAKNQLYGLYLGYITIIVMLVSAVISIFNGDVSVGQSIICFVYLLFFYTTLIFAKGTFNQQIKNSKAF